MTKSHATVGPIRVSLVDRADLERFAVELLKCFTHHPDPSMQAIAEAVGGAFAFPSEIVDDETQLGELVSLHDAKHEQQIEEALTEIGSDLDPPPGWKQGVLAQIEVTVESVTPAHFNELIDAAAAEQDLPLWRAGIAGLAERNAGKLTGEALTACVAEINKRRSNKP